MKMLEINNLQVNYGPIIAVKKVDLFVNFASFIEMDEKIVYNYLSKLKNILNLPEHLLMPSDPIKMHKNPDKVDKKLDNQAVKNLKLWYAKDYEFLDLVEEIKSSANI